MRDRRFSRTVQIGFGNSVMVDRVIAIFSVDTNPVKRLIADGKDTGLVVDLTKDKKTKSVILMDNDYLILSPINHSTLIKRLNGDDTAMSKNQLNEEEE